MNDQKKTIQDQKPHPMAGLIFGCLIIGFVLGLFVNQLISNNRSVSNQEIVTLKQIDDELISRLNDGIVLSSVAFDSFSKGDFSEMDVVQGESLMIARDVEQLMKQRKETLRQLGY